MICMYFYFLSMSMWTSSDVDVDVDVDLDVDVDVDVDKSFLECVTLLTAGSSSGTIISQERHRSGANKLEEVDAPCFVIPAKTLFSFSS